MEDILENLGIVLLIVISVAAQIAKAVKKASKARNTPSAETEEPVFEEAARKERDTTFSEIEPTYILTTPMETKKQKKKGMPANKPNLTEHHAAEEKPGIRTIMRLIPRRQNLRSQSTISICERQ